MRFDTEDEIVEKAGQILAARLYRRVKRRLSEYDNQYLLDRTDLKLISEMCRKHIAQRFDLSMGDMELMANDFRHLLKQARGVELRD